MWKSVLCTLILVAGLTACVTDHGTRPEKLASLPYPADAKVSPADGYLYEGTRIADGVYLFASPEPFHLQPYGNVTAIEQRDGFVLFDSGGTPAGATRILDMLAALSAKPVKAVVVSHWHGDHLNGLRTIVTRWPLARTIATNATRRTLSDPAVARFMPTGDPTADAAIRRNLDGALARLRAQSARSDLPEPVRAGNAQGVRELEQYGQELLGASYLIPAEGFDDRLLLDDPDRPVELRFLGRANTDGDAVAWLPRQKILLSGDILVSPIPYGFGSYPAEWIETITRLKAFDFKLLIPGHGVPMYDRTYADRLSVLLTAMREKVGALVAQGANLATIRRGIDLSEQARAFTGGDPWREMIFDQYWKQPIITGAYKEATDQAIMQGHE